MHDRRFNPQNFARLRSPERRALLEVDRAVNLALEGGCAKTALDIGSGSGMFAELLAQQAGFAQIEAILLQNLVLYRLTPGN